MQKNYPIIHLNNKEIHLIGTAHVSKDSKILVKEILTEIKPDTVCIELDKKRYDNLNNPDKFKNQNITSIIKQKQVGFLLVNLILASFQKRMAKNLDTNSGGEMIQGITSAKELNANLELVDRDIQTTFTRIWRKHSFFQKFKLIIAIISSIFEEEDISEEDLKNLQNSDMLDAALNEISKEFPIIKKVLVDERDQYLAKKIKDAPGNKIVAVLGAAHLPGVIENLNKEYSIEEISSVPKKTWKQKLSGWIIPIIIVALILVTFSINSSIGLQQIKTWFLINGSLSAIGVLLAMGHPLTILVAFIAAPITSLSPMLAAGWFAGLMEAHLRKPKVKDFENISNDMNFKGFYRNKVLKILLVVVLANLFSSLGTLIGSFDIVSRFFSSL